MSVAEVTAGPKRGWKSLGTWLGAAIVGVAAFCALFAPLLVPHDPFAQDLGKRLLVPFWMAGSDPQHILGTDQLGRDYLSRLIWGCRISMLIGVTVSIVSGLIGITSACWVAFWAAGSTTPCCSPSPPGCRSPWCWWRWPWSACSAAP